MFELTNDQRKYFGLDPIGEGWIRKNLQGDAHRPSSTLCFEDNILRKQIISTEDEYNEIQFEEPTRENEFFLPKASKGKEKKITPSTIESKTPIKTYCFVSKFGRILIGNHTNQLTFFDTSWEGDEKDIESPIANWVDLYIQDAPRNHFELIKEFCGTKRKNCKFRSGDFFRFKLNRTEYGFGRVLLDVYSIRKRELIPEEHGLYYLMGHPVLIKLYAFRSSSKNVDLNQLEKCASLPSDYIMDNALFYGNYEIVGHRDLVESDIEFPLSYGKALDSGSQSVFLQWGLIHLEQPIQKFNKFLVGELEDFPVGNPNRKINNPYGYYSIGFRPKYNSISVYKTIENGNYSFDSDGSYRNKFDLRNPSNETIRKEIFKAFGISSESTYFEIARKTKSQDLFDIIKQI